MQKLNRQNLALAANKVAHLAQGCTQGDNPADPIQAGIVHFGVGNFHRCHQAIYVDNLLDLGHRQWGIVGVSMRSSTIRDKLAPQDFLYTQATLSKEAGNNDVAFRIVRAITNILVAPENPIQVIDQVAAANIKLVTTTITEKGYCLSSGKLDAQHPDIIADLASLDTPQTVFGYLAAAIIQRSASDNGQLSILCCDNIQNGGDRLHSGVEMLLQKHDKDALAWADKYVSFASSMVDRVSPATDDTLRNLVSSSLDFYDAWPVSCEPFSQWVIEDNFAAQRPPFDKVGAVFSDDISAYEQVKLRFLNAGHSIISVLGYLEGLDTVHQALQQPHILNFTLNVLHKDALPVAKLPNGFDGAEYITQVIKRFQNSALPYTVGQVNTDSSQKIQQRWFPTIDDALAKNRDTNMLSLMLAAWVLYVQKSLLADDLMDPLKNELAAECRLPDHGLVPRVLGIAGAKHFDFYHSKPFMAKVLEQFNMLNRTKLSDALAQARS